MHTSRLIYLLLATAFMAGSCSQASLMDKPVAKATPLVTRDHLELVVKLAVIVTNPSDGLSISSGRLDDTQDGYEFHPTLVSFPTFEGQATSWQVPYVVKLDRSGRVREVSKMPENRMSRAVRQFGIGINGDGSNWILGKLRSGIRTTVLLEFKKPILERNFDTIGRAENAFPIFLSRARRSGHPIYWSGNEGCFKSSAFPRCIEYSSVEQFRSWVFQLRPEDDAILDGFGLSVAELQQIAAEGLVYGTIVDGGSPEFLRELQRNPNLAGMWIVDMRPCPPADDCP